MGLGLGEGVCTQWQACCQKTTCESQFSLWVSGIKLRMLGLVAKPFPGCAILPALKFWKSWKKNLFSVPIPAMFLMNTSPVLCVIRGVKEEHSGVSVGAERKFQGRAAGCLCSIIFQLYKKNKADCWNPQSWLSGWRQLWWTVWASTSTQLLQSTFWWCLKLFRSRGSYLPIAI